METNLIASRPVAWSVLGSVVSAVSLSRRWCYGRVLYA